MINTQMTHKLVDTSNIKTQEDVEDYLADLAGVVRDKEPKNASKLFERLMKESVGNKPSRMFEYIPCKIHNSSVHTTQSQLFGFKIYLNEASWEYNYYTNARELLNWGWAMEDILDAMDFSNYTVFKCVTPYFMYGQISTHNQLTTVSHSQRYTDSQRGFWKPPEVKFSQEKWNYLIRHVKTPTELEALMKSFGIKRKEVYARGADMLQYRAFSIGGYTNNPNAFQHFDAQRTDSHTQKETREFVESMMGVTSETL